MEYMETSGTKQKSLIYQPKQSIMKKIENESQLRELYGFPSGRAKQKSLNALEKHSINYISKSPFMVLATVNNAGQMDVSPRGGDPGFVHVLSETELVIPDARGNNRIDSLVNIVETGRVATLFMLPGIDETLRVNGSAYITADPALINRFDDERIKSCIIINVEETFLHCAKAFMRSKLWDISSQIPRSEFPTMGQMMKDQLNTNGEVEAHADMVKRYQKDI